ncbi:hypothetical protein BDM02DRAFT_1760835 [Thelephora ganbajun]|uniref:Uncharacterized protein n=1 Tax=Thelephora ganbajun TaxID=370292 RepID=A0ACB6YZX5_THEGA|nr:hypothetical protein BDM02DRAFT_1760835 [Thelephora ganbajun]
MCTVGTVVKAKLRSAASRTYRGRKGWEERKNHRRDTSDEEDGDLRFAFFLLDLLWYVGRDTGVTWRAYGTCGLASPTEYIVRSATVRHPSHLGQRSAIGGYLEYDQLRGGRIKSIRTPAHDQSKSELIPSIRRTLQPLVEMAGSFVLSHPPSSWMHQKQPDIGYYIAVQPSVTQRVENGPACSKKRRNYQIKARKIRGEVRNKRTTKPVVALKKIEAV